MEALAPEVVQEKSALAGRRLMTFDAEKRLDIGADDFVFDAPGVESIAAECAGIILATGNEARAATLLAAGAPCVLLGEAALLDSTVVERLSSLEGAAIGIYVPAQRQAVSWSFETVSNADFKTVTPSYCEPAWEILRADGTPTGTLATWWLDAMRERGASCFLICADVRDDTDLNILAGFVETFGNRLWVGPRTDSAPPLADWVAFGQCRQLALPPSLFEQHADMLSSR